MPNKNKKRVVITGLGPVTSIGLGKKTFWNSLIKGKKSFGKVTRFDPNKHNLKTKIASEIKNFDPTDFVTKKEASRMDRYCQYAIAGTLMAFEDSELSMKKLDSDQFGVVIGTAIGGIESLYNASISINKYGIKRISPAIVPLILPGLVASQIAMMLKAHGPTKVLSTTCTSATHAIGDAFNLIRNEDAKVIVTGGADCCITEWNFIGFHVLNAMSNRNDDPSCASRPFDKDRDGFVMGEGAGIFILEELEHALKRGAKIYAELSGYGATSDAFHITAPLADGSMSAKAIKKALNDAKVEPKEVNYINAHGTSTKYNDLYETKAIKNAFGRYAKKIPISSTKSMIGHSQGACGGIEAIATALSITNNTVHPTVNLKTPDPECDLDYVPNKARDHKINVAVSNSLGFGGNNAVLVFKKFTPK